MIRLMDILFSLLGLIILFPLLFIIFLIIKFSGTKEVLFNQERVGKGGKTFKLHKFSTMNPDAQVVGPLVSKSDDPRITPIGKILRRCKLNELPQLFNVLKGDMGFVGPRPEVQKYLESLPKDLKEKLLSVKPGITSLTTLLFREEDKLMEGEEDWEGFYLKKILPKKAEIEIEYIERRNFFSDMRVLIVTVLVLFKVLRYPKFVKTGGKIVLK